MPDCTAVWNVVTGMGSMVLVETARVAAPQGSCEEGVHTEEDAMMNQQKSKVSGGYRTGSTASKSGVVKSRFGSKIDQTRHWAAT